MNEKKTSVINPKTYIFLYLLSGIIFGTFTFTQTSNAYADSIYGSSSKQKFVENGIQYEKTGSKVVDTKQGITYKFHSKTNSYSLKKAEPKKDSISIPDRIQGKKVLKLDAYAFYNTKIKKTELGKYVSSIGKWCFYKCKSLYQIKLPASIKKIDDTAFQACDASKLTYIAPRFSSPYKILTQRGETMLTSSTKLKFTALTGMMVAGENKMIAALNSKEKLKWKSSNSSVLKISKSGSAKALKPGTVTLKAYNSKQTFKLHMNVLSRTKNNVMKVITSEYVRPEITDFEKAAAAHAYLIRNVKYDYQNYLNNTIPDASYTANGALLKGIAVCEGYAKAFQEIMEYYHIPCAYVTNSGHGWNAVKIGGKYFHCDVTFDDPIINGKNHNTKVYTEYFLIPDNKLSKTHQGYSFHCNTSNSNVNMKSRTLSNATLKSSKARAVMPYLNAKKLSLVAGGNVFHLKLAGAKALSFSSNSNAVSVSKTGKIRAVAKGTALVTVKDSNQKKYTCRVKVESPKINHTSINLEENESAILKITGTTKKVTWKSADPSIAKINKNGTVKAISEGRTKVFAVVYGCTISCNVAVTAKNTDDTDETELYDPSIERDPSADEDINQNGYYQPPAVVDKSGSEDWDDREDYQYTFHRDQSLDENLGENEYYESSTEIDISIDEEPDEYMQNPYDDENSRWIDFINVQR